MSVTTFKITSPYPGLRPFEREEAAIFFGRETQTDEMLARLEDQPNFKFLAVLGASGSGKSSLVRAGLIPALDRGFLLGAPAKWKFVIARPGEAPLRNLAEAWVETWHPQPESPEPADIERHKVDVDFALAQFRGGPLGIARAYRGDSTTKDHAILVLIDQFEELFRFRSARDSSQPAVAVTAGDSATDDSDQDAQQTQETEQERQRNESATFVELLLMTARQTDVPIYVAITMRSEFLGDCDAFTGLPESISRSQYLTPRMLRAQLSEAITRPLEIPEFQADIEPALVTRILNDVGTESDQLPLMQHVLMRTWQWRSVGVGRTVLSIEDYKSFGGVSGALDQHADDIFKSLGAETTRARLQRVVERLFCSLSERADGGPLTRRPITVRDAAFEIGDDQTSDKIAGSRDSSSEQPPGILSVKAAQQDVMTVAKAFQKANLLVFSPPNQSLSLDTRIDISHESLLRNWSLLNDWRLAEEEAAKQYRSLVHSARDYFSSQGELLHGLGLQTALKWWNHQSVPTTYGWSQRYAPATYGVARQYLVLSREEQERLKKQAESEAKEKAQTRYYRVWTQSILAALVVVSLVMTLAAMQLSRSADNEREARNDTEKTNQGSMQLAAEFIAKAVGQDLQSRWLILEREAADPELPRRLQALESEPFDPAVGDRDLQLWLSDRISQYDSIAPASSWIVLDRQGMLRGRYPKSETIGKNFAFRDYFHGLGHDHDPAQKQDFAPLTRPHRSNVFRDRTDVFRSQTDDLLVTTLSVPIWSYQGNDRRVVGVLATSMQIGQFEILESQLGGDRVLRLVDTNNSAQDERGTILYDSRHKNGTLAQKSQRIPDSLVNELEQLRLLRVQQQRQQLATSGFFKEHFTDVADDRSTGRKYAAFEPVILRTASRELHDTGWVVIVQQMTSARESR